MSIFTLWYGAAQSQTPGKKYFKDLKKFENSIKLKGRPDYEKIIADSLNFKNLIFQTQIADLLNVDINSRKAFLIDAYNLSVIQIIINNYPVKSVKNIPGFFDAITVTVANKTYTLNQLEDKIRNEFADWKLRWVLVNGTADAPLLKFYSPKELESQLENQVIAVYNHPHYVLVDTDSETVLLNSIFRSSENEITQGKNIKIHLNEYLYYPIPYSYNISYKPYNWNLNKSFNKADKENSENKGATKTKFWKKDSLKFDNDDGQDLPSNLIRRKRLEVRVTNTLYTQTAFYNNKMNRIDDTSRFSYNTLALKATYGISDKLNVGALLTGRYTYADARNNSPFELYTSTVKEKGIYNNLQFFCKTNLYERKSQGSLYTYVTIPLRTVQPGEVVPDDNNRYLFHAIFVYDAFITPFIRTSINLEGGLNYDSKPHTITPKFKPSILFSSLIYSTNVIRFTAGVDFDWNYNSLNFVNFIAREYLVLNLKLTRKLSINTNYNYFFIGKNTGAGHSFVLGGRYLF